MGGSPTPAAEHKRSAPMRLGQRRSLGAILAAGAAASAGAGAFCAPPFRASPSRSLLPGPGPLRVASNPYDRFALMQDAHWDGMCALLERYRQTEGHADVPYNYHVRLGSAGAGAGPASSSAAAAEADDDLVNLGRWLRRQRQIRSQGKLSPGRIGRLDGLGVRWDGNPALSDAYTVTVSRRLKADSEGYARWRRSFDGPSQGGGEGRPDRSVASWVESIDVPARAMALGRGGAAPAPGPPPRGGSESGSRGGASRPGSTPPEGRWDAVREGWLSPDVDRDGGAVRGTWDQFLGLLVQYRRREGHAEVPPAHREDGIALGLWLEANRTRVAAGAALGGERRRILRELGVRWAA